MMNISDSFVTFLSQQLNGTLTVHWLRSSSTETDSAVMKHNACNVKVLGFYGDGSAEMSLISVDVLGSNERQVIGWCNQIKRVLLSEMAPEMDYSGPAPMATGQQIFWKKDELGWQVVRSSSQYVHYNLTLSVRHHNGSLYRH